MSHLGWPLAAPPRDGRVRIGVGKEGAQVAMKHAELGGRERPALLIVGAAVLSQLAVLLLQTRDELRLVDLLVDRHLVLDACDALRELARGDGLIGMVRRRVDGRTASQPLPSTRTRSSSVPSPEDPV